MTEQETLSSSKSLSASTRPIEVLLVEDDDDDVLLMERSFASDRILCNVQRVEDGVEALDYLKRRGPYANATRPDLILLDLNMPRKDGRQTLKEIKEDPNLSSIPVVVLTSSDDQHDIAASYAHRANSFVTKPVNLVRFRKVLQEIKSYWFAVVALPPKPTSDEFGDGLPD